MTTLKSIANGQAKRLHAVDATWSQRPEANLMGTLCYPTEQGFSSFQR